MYGWACDGQRIETDTDTSTFIHAHAIKVHSTISEHLWVAIDTDDILQNSQDFLQNQVHAMHTFDFQIAISSLDISWYWLGFDWDSVGWILHPDQLKIGSFIHRDLSLFYCRANRHQSVRLTLLIRMTYSFISLQSMLTSDFWRWIARIRICYVMIIRVTLTVTFIFIHLCSIFSIKL